MAQVTLTANQTAVVDLKNKSINRHGNTIEQAQTQGNTAEDTKQEVLLLSFLGQVPQGAAINFFEVYVYAKMQTSGSFYARGNGFPVEVLPKAFSADTVTASTLGNGVGTVSTRTGKALSTGFAWCNEKFTLSNATAIMGTIENGVQINLTSSSSVGGNYTVTGNFYSNLSDQKPYLIVDYSPPQMTATPQFAEGTYFPKNIDSKISWASVPTGASKLYGTPVQTGGEVRIKNGETITTLSVGPEEYVTVPAGAFTVDAPQIQLALDYTAEGRAETDWITVNTVDALPTATPLSPAGQTVNGNTPITFSWDYSIDTGTPQGKAELQASYDDGGSWHDLASFTGPTQSGQVDAGILQAGTVAWRVRAYNMDGAPGPWSEAAHIVVRAAAKAPATVTADDLPMLTVSWESTAQQGYQLQIFRGETVSYDSGTVWGTTRSQTVNDYMDDGEYTARVRITDRQGLWSAWTAYTGTITNTPGVEFELTAQPVPYGVRLNWTTDDGYSAYYVLRDGVPVARVTGGEWLDMLAAPGARTYMVRATNGGNYTDSPSKTEIVRVRYGAISLMEPINWLLLKWSNGGPAGHQEEMEAQHEFVQYQGHRLPSYWMGGGEDIDHKLDYCLRNASDYQTLQAMLGKLVVYKDYRGARVIGALTKVSAERGKRINVTLTITETDYKEHVDYVP